MKHSFVQAVNSKDKMHVPQKNIEQFLMGLTSEAVSTDNIKHELANYVNYLILHDFQTLVQLLYRLDVGEIKIKKALQFSEDRDAGITISELIIQRHMEKIAARKTAANNDTNISQNEKW